MELLLKNPIKLAKGNQKYELTSYHNHNAMVSLDRAPSHVRDRIGALFYAAHRLNLLKTRSPYRFCSNDSTPLSLALHISTETSEMCKIMIWSVTESCNVDFIVSNGEWYKKGVAFTETCAGERKGSVTIADGDHFN